MDFGAPNRHFQARKFKCPITFLKISIRALHFWIKTWIFIQLIWFLIPHNNEGVPNRIYKEFRKRSSKRSSYIFSNFENFQICSRNWTFFYFKFEKLKLGQCIGAPFWAPFSKFFVNPFGNNLNIMWDQKSNQLDKNSSIYPKMKCPNQYV